MSAIIISVNNDDKETFSISFDSNGDVTNADELIPVLKELANILETPTVPDPELI